MSYDTDSPSAKSKQKSKSNAKTNAKTNTSSKQSGLIHDRVFKDLSGNKAFREAFLKK